MICHNIQNHYETSTFFNLINHGVNCFFIMKIAGMRVFITKEIISLALLIHSKVIWQWHFLTPKIYCFNGPFSSRIDIDWILIPLIWSVVVYHSYKAEFSLENGGGTSRPGWREILSDDEVRAARDGLERSFYFLRGVKLEIVVRNYQRLPKITKDNQR